VAWVAVAASMLRVVHTGGGTGSFSLMDEVTIRGWFDEYSKAFAERGRGESDDLHAFLEYYAVPIIVATDDAAQALTTAEEVMGFACQQVEGMRAASYDHTETIDSELTTLNATSVLYRGDFVRQRADDSEITRFGVTYLITDGSAGLRISALAVQAP
jgi:hypothetical protein